MNGIKLRYHVNLYKYRMIFSKYRSDTTEAIMFYLVACLCTALMGATIRHLSNLEVHSFVMVFFRNIISFVLISPWLFKNGLRVIKTEHLYLHLLRGFSGFIGMVFFFQALVYMPLTEAVSLSFMVPLFTTICAIIFLQEFVGIRRWCAILAGFSGMLVIIRPGIQEINSAAFLVLGATIAWSASNILVKKLTKTEKPMVIVFYMTGSIIPMSIPLALPHIEWLSFEQLLYLVVLSAISTIAQYCMSRSYAKADISFLQPFDFSRLVFTAVIAFFAFSEIIDIYTIIGAIIIVSASVYITRRERKSAPA